MLVTTRNQQYSFECKQDTRFLQIIDLFEQKKIRYIDRKSFYFNQAIIIERREIYPSFSFNE